jgi:uncharacterized protein YndB with AHSA1/START domain
MEITQTPIAKAEMLIRRPFEKVFEAFIDPSITSKFWFTKGSRRLEEGKQVQWDWEMYGTSTKVDVKKIEPNKRILIEWDGYSGRTSVEWLFNARSDNETFVTVSEFGWTGNGDELVKYALNSTGGFTFMISGLKAFLEHNIILNLTADHAPDKIKAGL